MLKLPLATSRSEADKMAESAANTMIVPVNPRPPASVEVYVTELTGTIFLGALAVLLTVVLAVVVIRLTGRRSN